MMWMSYKKVRCAPVGGIYKGTLMNPANGKQFIFMQHPHWTHTTPGAINSAQIFEVIDGVNKLSRGEWGKTYPAAQCKEVTDMTGVTDIFIMPDAYTVSGEITSLALAYNEASCRDATHDISVIVGRRVNRFGINALADCSEEIAQWFLDGFGMVVKVSEVNRQYAKITFKTVGWR